MLISWIRNRFYNRGRAIFRFWDGSTSRRIDPMVVYRRLLEHPEFDWETTPLLIDVHEEAVAADAIRLSADAVRVAFEIPELSETKGLTEIECVQLLQLFVQYLTALKKNISGARISQAPTVPESSEESTTKQPSVCG